MAKYASNDQKNFKIGISSFSDNKTSLEVIGRVGINSSSAKSALDVAGSVNVSDGLSVTGLSTFTGIGTFVGDLYVGGDLNVVGDLVYDEVTGRNLNITGVATVGTAFTVNGPSNLVDTFVSGALTATTFTGAGTGLTGITSATNATNIYGGATGQLLYQAQPGITSAFENGTTGQGLFSRGTGQPPQWLAAAPSGAIEGLLLFDEGAVVGGGITYSGLDFRGLDVTATGGNNGGIATITVAQQSFVTLAGIATNVIGGIASVTQLNVNAGVSSFADFKITSSGVGATVGTSAGITTYYGSGTELTGIVTSIVAGANISVSSSTGQVTIIGLANTANVSAETLVVSGISTLGIITGAESLGVGTVYATNIVGGTATFSDDVSVGGTFNGSNAIFSGNVTIGGTLTYEDVASIDAVGFVTARTGLNVGYTTGPSGIGVTVLPDGSGVFAGILTAQNLDVVTELNVGSATSQFTVVSSGSTIMVGIGTTNPLHTLDVRGDTNIEGNLTVNNNTIPSLAMVIALGGL